MSGSTDAILLAGIKDMRAAIDALPVLRDMWVQFTSACQAQNLELAHVLAERISTMTETVLDLQQSAARRMSQFQRLTEGSPHD